MSAEHMVLDLLLASRQEDARGLRRLHLACALVERCGALIHQLQTERGLTNHWLASTGQAAVAALAQARSDTDTALGQWQAALEPWLGREAPSAPKLLGQLALTLQGGNALGLLRAKADQGAWDLAQITQAYGLLIQSLLGVVFEAADLSSHPELARRLVALFNLMQGKELAGQERANGVALFAAGRATPAGQARHAHLLDMQGRCRQSFLEFATPESAAAWQTVQTPMQSDTVVRLRERLMSTEALQGLDPALSQDWFEACSRRMDQLRQFERWLLDELRGASEALLAQAQREIAQLERQAPGLAGDGPEAFFAAVQREALPDEDDTLRYGQRLHRSLLDMVVQHKRQLQQAQDELASAKASLQERKLIERAKGLLMAHRRVSEDEAHAMLRQTAMAQKRRLADVAQSVLGMAAVFPTRP